MYKFTNLTNKQLSAMSPADLLITFNEAAALLGAPICKRFSSHASGFNRTTKIVEQAREHEAAHGSVAAEPVIAAAANVRTKEAVAAEVKAKPETAVEPSRAASKKGAKIWEVPADGSCPKCGSKFDITPAGLEGTAAEQRNFCHPCGFEWWPDTGKEYLPPANNPGVRAEAVSKTWEDPAIRAKRIERTHVQVSGGKLKGKVMYDSVRKAFLDLRLPMAKHIKLRIAMKAAGSAKMDDYTFTAVPKVAEVSPAAAPKPAAKKAKK